MEYNYIYSQNHGISEIEEIRVINRGGYRVYIVDRVEFLRDHDDNCGDGFISIFKGYDNNIEVFVLLDNPKRLHDYVDLIIKQFYDDNMEDNNEEED